MVVGDMLFDFFEFGVEGLCGLFCMLLRMLSRFMMFFFGGW